MENHHEQSSTCHRLDRHIVNTSHGRIDQSPRQARHAPYPVVLSTSRTLEQNVKQVAPRRRSTTPIGRRATTRLLIAPTAASSERQSRARYAWHLPWP